MKVNCELVYLHAPYFHITGMNLGERLDTRQRKDLKATWDTEEKEMTVEFQGRVGMIPESNVKSYFPYNNVTPIVEEKKKDEAPREKIKAQASSPTGHVFAGPGGGKVNF